GIADLLPLDPAETPPPLPELAKLYPLRPAKPVRQADASGPDQGSVDGIVDVGVSIGTGASNNWVVSGARTRSGKPLLANDPHLKLDAPAVWYLAHLALERPGSAPANIVGASVPGLPRIVLGRGDHV